MNCWNQMLKVSCHHNYDQRLVNKIIVNICITLLTKEVTFQNLFNYHAHDAKVCMYTDVFPFMKIMKKIAWSFFLKHIFHKIAPESKRKLCFFSKLWKYDIKYSARIGPRPLQIFLRQMNCWFWTSFVLKTCLYFLKQRKYT